MVSDVQKAASTKYDKTHTKMVLLKLNTKTDADILMKLEDSTNKQGYIKSLIRRDIRGERKQPSPESLRYSIQPVVKAFNLKKVVLFGSYARNEATEESDVDLLIEGGAISSMADFLKLQNAFEAAIGKKVDVVDGSILNQDSRASKRFKEHIERDKIILYE